MQPPRVVCVSLLVLHVVQVWCCPWCIFKGYELSHQKILHRWKICYQNPCIHAAHDVIQINRWYL